MLVRRALLLCLLLLPLRCVAEEAQLTCTADTNLSSYPGETEMNYGQSTRLRLKGIQMLALLRFDTTPIKGWKVEKATLYLRYAGSDRKLRTLGFSTVSAPWSEGTGAGEKRAGETCFTWREHGKTRWAGPDTDFTDVSFTAGHTLADYADIQPAPEKGDGWFSASVAPRLVRAMLADLSYGLAVTDEKGQTQANNDIYSREQSNSQPILVVSGHPITPPQPKGIVDIKAVADPAHADFQNGAVRLTFTAPERALGYRVNYVQTVGAPATIVVPRYTLPFAQPGRQEAILLQGLPPATQTRIQVAPVGETGASGPSAAIQVVASAAKPKPAPLLEVAFAAPDILDPPVRANRLRLWAYPDSEKAHPVSGNLLEEVGTAAYGGGAQGVYRRYNPVWDGRTVRLEGARNEILGVQLLVEATDRPLKGVTITSPTALKSADNRTIQPSVTLYRDWYVKGEKGTDWYPEVCVPLTGSFDLPAVDNAVPGQKNQSVFVDLLVPQDALPGTYTGVFTLTADGIPAQSLPITLTINRLLLPDTLSFDISLNTYGTVGGPFGLDDRTPEYRALEREYHRMAHLHRSTLAPLGYSHTGRISTNYAPPLEGDGAQMRITDWSAWDDQFGPYLDGSAFADLPRKGVPLTHLYLPFHEAWPGDIRKHYHYAPRTLAYPETITEHALTAPPIEQAMDKQMADAFMAVTGQYVRHLQEKRWTKTQYQFYQNDKHYYKDPKQSGQGTSWWLLDEPNHRDDWLALAYFARLFRAGVGANAKVSMVHREDISRPQWQRDYLDGLVDLMVASGELYTKGPRLREMQEQQGVRLWNYGTANEVQVSNLEAEAWAIRAWLAGADAIVPWQSVGDDGNYKTPEATALLLPGKRFGITGPIASLRLKALRRAQQDAEYLILLAKEKGWDREQTAAAISGLLPLKGVFTQTDSDDAGRYRFGALHAADFAALRRAIGR